MEIINMKSRINNITNGLGHRLISMVPGILAFAATAFDYNSSGQATAVLPILGSIVLMVLGFMAPIILTEGFKKPIPDSGTLAIGSKGFHLTLFVVGVCLLFGPGAVRIVARLFGAT